MAVIELARKTRGGHARGAKSDLRVYATRENSKKRGRWSLGIRVSEATMKRLRWILGDFVAASFNDETQSWTLCRVSDRTGNALSGQGKKTGSGTVRFAIDESHLGPFGLDSGEGYDCVLVSSDTEAAVFTRV